MIMFTVGLGDVVARANHGSQWLIWACPSLALAIHMIVLTVGLDDPAARVHRGAQ